jgi:hypothetical protein
VVAARFHVLLHMRQRQLVAFRVRNLPALSPALQNVVPGIRPGIHVVVESGGGGIGIGSWNVKSRESAGIMQWNRNQQGSSKKRRAHTLSLAFIMLPGSLPSKGSQEPLVCFLLSLDELLDEDIVQLTDASAGRLVGLQTSIGYLPITYYSGVFLHFGKLYE